MWKAVNPLPIITITFYGRIYISVPSFSCCPATAVTAAAAAAFAISIVDCVYSIAISPNSTAATAAGSSGGNEEGTKPFMYFFFFFFFAELENLKTLWNWQ